MLTLVTGYSKSGRSTLVKLLNDQMPWNYAIYSERTLYTKGNSPAIEIQIQRDEKTNDPYHFILKCYIEKLQGNQNFFITNFKYKEEYMFLRSKGLYPMTMRIFRKGIEPADSSETKLDNFKTHFLLVPLENYEEEFAEAVEKFPQYHSFQKQSRSFFHT